MTVDTTTLGFLDKLNTDAEMQADLQTALEGAADRTGAIVAWATSRGFAINREGLDEVRRLLAAGTDELGALDESELEEVAGGFNPQPEPPALISDLVRRIRPVTQTLING